VNENDIAEAKTENKVSGWFVIESEVK